MLFAPCHHPDCAHRGIGSHIPAEPFCDAFPAEQVLAAGGMGRFLEHVRAQRADELLVDVPDEALRAVPHDAGVEDAMGLMGQMPRSQSAALYLLAICCSHRAGDTVLRYPTLTSALYGGG